MEMATESGPSATMSEHGAGLAHLPRVAQGYQVGMVQGRGGSREVGFCN